MEDTARQPHCLKELPHFVSRCPNPLQMGPTEPPKCLSLRPPPRATPSSLFALYAVGGSRLIVSNSFLPCPLLLPSAGPCLNPLYTIIFLSPTHVSDALASSGHTVSGEFGHLWAIGCYLKAEEPSRGPYLRSF